MTNEEIRNKSEMRSAKRLFQGISIFGLLSSFDPALTVGQVISNWPHN